ncbi:MAG TPA: class I SAM-dependent methyltransferase [Thermoplasmata archaeon]
MEEYNPFGRKMLDMFEGRRDDLLEMERDDGYIDELGLGEYFADYDDFPVCEKDALERVKGRVLDIGLGPGRVSLHLQSKGFEVFGIDLTSEAVQVARRRGVLHAARMSACELGFAKSMFDTAILFGNNFGLCGSPERVVDMLAALRDIVTDDGVVLAESIDHTDTDKPAHLAYTRMNVERGRLPGQIVIRNRYKGAVGDWFELLLVTPEEMRALAAQAGWRIERLLSAQGRCLSRSCARPR